MKQAISDHMKLRNYKKHPLWIQLHIVQIKSKVESPKTKKCSSQGKVFLSLKTLEKSVKNILEKISVSYFLSYLGYF